MMLYFFFGFIINEEFDHFLLLSHCLLILLYLIEYALFFLLLSYISEGKFEFFIDFEDLIDIMRGLRALRWQVIRLN